MIDAEYAEGAEQSPYIQLTESTGDEWQLDASKVCQIDNPDCEACQ